MSHSLKRRSSSMGAACDASSIGATSQKGSELTMASRVEDLETARRLLSSLLYTKDASGRSYLHTNFRLSWAKALLDRAKHLDENSDQYVDLGVASMDPYKSNNNGRSRKGSYSGVSHGRTSLMQRRFLLQPDQESGYTPFHRAIIEGNLVAMLLFLRHVTSDEGYAERLTQRPMTLLHAAEANHGHTRANKNSNNLLMAMSNATDHEGMTPLRLLGKLQQSELFRCRKDMESFRPSVDRNFTMRMRTRSRISSFDDNGNDSGNETT
eukprot:CAMPEP_0201188070 /NCGR_PEP_ID=MMETSP0851-20130426/134695_1 /ASSEMBLY_ACC=CAM_ASM_000631 /TAXON_ID=183588 /ORGANISM="Pseudo-nitzschia fraudulenta, Strain WWA7" /LENGTH=266 /DNA_ID=CAMNT_0047473633 /DNA_START=285 /DNA_END=1081 /DNA_ORIENTATION=+